jgi:primosomal protein N'
MAYINRFKSGKDIRHILKQVEAGKIDILIGTHRIVNKDVIFKDLGLLVIDEEQKFGVSVKEKLKKLRVNVDVLTLTANANSENTAFFTDGCTRSECDCHSAAKPAAGDDRNPHF